MVNGVCSCHLSEALRQRRDGTGERLRKPEVSLKALAVITTVNSDIRDFHTQFSHHIIIQGGEWGSSQERVSWSGFTCTLVLGWWTFLHCILLIWFRMWRSRRFYWWKHPWAVNQRALGKCPNLLEAYLNSCLLRNTQACTLHPKSRGFCWGHHPFPCEDACLCASLVSVEHYVKLNFL